MVVMSLVLALAGHVRNSFPVASMLRNYVTSSLFLGVLLAAWWEFRATFYFNSFAGILESLFLGRKMAVPIPSRFFEIPLFERLKVIALLHLNGIVIALVSFVGLCVFIVMLRRKDLEVKAKNFYLQLILFLSIILAAVFFQFVVGYVGTGYKRYLNYALVLRPFLAGLALLYLDKYLAINIRNGIVKNLAFTCILFMLFSLCLVEVFPYQPFVPRANVVSKDLPEDIYLLDFRAVNTIYQRDMILFAENFSSSDARIASDITTRFQIYGFAGPSFSSRNIWYSPLENPNLKWDLFLLHTNEKAAPFNEKAEYHTTEIINGFREAGNTIYDNGMSIILERALNST